MVFRGGPASKQQCETQSICRPICSPGLFYSYRFRVQKKLSVWSYSLKPAPPSSRGGISNPGFPDTSHPLRRLRANIRHLLGPSSAFGGDFKKIVIMAGHLGTPTYFTGYGENVECTWSILRFADQVVNSPQGCSNHYAWSIFFKYGHGWYFGNVTEKHFPSLIEHC